MPLAEQIASAAGKVPIWDRAGVDTTDEDDLPYINDLVKIKQIQQGSSSDTRTRRRFFKTPSEVYAAAAAAAAAERKVAQTSFPAQNSLLLAPANTKSTDICTPVA